MAEYIPEQWRPLVMHSQENVKNKRYVKNADGTVSTVRSGSVSDKRLNGGKETLIPFVWNGRVLDSKEAIRMAIESGVSWPAFDSVEEATHASKIISRQADSWAPR